jgi:hypothetical protein
LNDCFWSESVAFQGLERSDELHHVADTLVHMVTPINIL